MQAKKIKRHRQNEFIFILNDSKKEINEHNKNLLHENYISTIDYSELDEKIGLLIKYIIDVIISMFILNETNLKI